MGLLKATEGLGLTTSSGKITRFDLGLVRVRRSQGLKATEGLGLTTCGGKMSGEGGVTLFSLEVLLAAILGGGAGGLIWNTIDY